MTYGKQTDKKKKKNHTETECKITKTGLRKHTPSGGMGGAWAVGVFFVFFLDLARGIISMRRVNVVQKPTPTHLFL